MSRQPRSPVPVTLLHADTPSEKHAVVELVELVEQRAASSHAVNLRDAKNAFAAESQEPESAHGTLRVRVAAGIGCT